MATWLTPSGYEIEGLFRVSGSEQNTKLLFQNLLIGEEINWEEQDPHDVATAAKRLLRCTPESVFTESMYEDFVKIRDSESAAVQLQEYLERLPCYNRQLVYKMTVLFGKISESKTSMMNIFQLSLCMTPNLGKRLAVTFPDVSRLFEVLVRYQTQIFDVCG